MVFSKELFADEVRDTTDTDTKSEYDSEVELEVEYEVASLSGDEENPLDNTSSSGSDVHIFFYDSHFR